MSRVVLAISVFNRQGCDRILEMIELPDIPYKVLHKQFPECLPDDPYFCYVYDINKDHVSFFQKYVEIRFDFEKYEYFFERFLKNNQT